MNFESFKKYYEKVKPKEIENSVQSSIVVSICVVTFNHVSFIKKCLDDILMQQTNFDFEILLGEDASTDGTREICIEYAQKYPNKIRLFLHHRENNISINGSPTGRFNFLYNLYSAKGKYIALCEGDDYWTDPYKLQKQVDFLEATPEYAACFHYTQQNFINNPDKLGRIFGKHENQLDYTAEDTIATLSPWHTSSFVFKTTAFVKPDWLYKVVSGDMALFSIVAKSGNIKCTPEIMSVYQKHDGGITQTKAHNHEDYHNNRIALIKHLDAYHNFKYHKKAEEVIAFHVNAINNPNSNKKSIFERVINRLKRLTK